MRSHVLSSFAYPLQVVIGMLAYRKHVNTLYGQATGRFSGEEISSLRKQIWDTINDLLVEVRRSNPGAAAVRG